MAIDIKLMHFEVEKGREDGYLWARDKSIEEIKKELKLVKETLDNMVRELGTGVYDNIDYFYLLGWRQGVYKVLKEKEREK